MGEKPDRHWQDYTTKGYKSGKYPKPCDLHNTAFKAGRTLGKGADCILTDNRDALSDEVIGSKERQASELISMADRHIVG